MRQRHLRIDSTANAASHPVKKRGRHGVSARKTVALEYPHRIPEVGPTSMEGHLQQDVQEHPAGSTSANASRRCQRRVHIRTSAAIPAMPATTLPDPRAVMPSITESMPASCVRGATRKRACRQRSTDRVHDILRDAAEQPGRADEKYQADRELEPHVAPRREAIPDKRQLGRIPLAHGHHPRMTDQRLPAPDDIVLMSHQPAPKPVEPDREQVCAARDFAGAAGPFAATRQLSPAR